MQYFVAGVLKAGTGPHLQENAAALNEHLAQPYRRICFAAALRAESGKRKGYAAVIEAETFADAENYLHQSPLYAAGLYERYEIAELMSRSGQSFSDGARCKRLISHRTETI